MWSNENNNKRIYKGTSGGKCICFSSSSDQQVSADTKVYTGIGISSGAATYAFIESIEKGQCSTYGQLLHSIHQILSPSNQIQRHKINARKSRSFLNGFINCFAAVASPQSTTTHMSTPILQDVQLSASESFDLRTHFVI